MVFKNLDDLPKDVRSIVVKTFLVTGDTKRLTRETGTENIEIREFRRDHLRYITIRDNAIVLFIDLADPLINIPSVNTLVINAGFVSTESGMEGTQATEEVSESDWHLCLLTEKTVAI